MRLLEEAGHGSWTSCVDLAPQDGRRRTRRRGGFATEAEAAQELAAVLEGELSGAYEERRTTVADYLWEWLAARKEELTVNTYAGYKAYVERDLIPAFGRCRLLDLRPKQIEAWTAAQRKAGRGRGHAVPGRLDAAQRAEPRGALLAAEVQPGRALRAAQAPRRGTHLLDTGAGCGVPAAQLRAVRRPARIGLHDLRHTTASIMIAEGISIAIVSKTLRHATIATTINLYGHLLKGSADQAVNALARALDQAQTNPLTAKLSVCGTRMCTGPQHLASLDSLRRPRRHRRRGPLRTRRPNGQLPGGVSQFLGKPRQ
ncbi:tyrosine-type recombinase/integrase [Kitasatospora purpeofusca]|uniref:tyrosine-type recombinase/integrase n=1 Tax=Kitasatospora purpeofusca TaxID=67352 RepID=UPI0004BF79E7|nr:tyrosine-type recombinase/integrase [Kitasatospora purpeofusca]